MESKDGKAHWINCIKYGIRKDGKAHWVNCCPKYPHHPAGLLFKLAVSSVGACECHWNCWEGDLFEDRLAVVFAYLMLAYIFYWINLNFKSEQNKMLPQKFIFTAIIFRIKNELSVWVSLGMHYSNHIERYYSITSLDILPLPCFM